MARRGTWLLAVMCACGTTREPRAANPAASHGARSAAASAANDLPSSGTKVSKGGSHGHGAVVAPVPLDERAVAIAAASTKNDKDASASATKGGASPRRAALHYELNGKAFPLPVVRGSVAGTPTWMLVDTGANSHVVAGWLARQMGLALKKDGDVGADHAGRSITTFRVERPQLVIDGWGALDDASVLAADVPTLIEQLGIGVFLSPQRLVEGELGGVVLDLAGGELRAAPYEEAAHAVAGEGRALAPRGGRVCEDTAGAVHGIAFVLPARVEGRPVSLLLDTGAQRTDLLLGSPAGHALARRSVANHDQLYAASGRMTSRTVKRASINVGDFTVRTDIDLIPGSADPYCPRDGVVSMDVLHACTLVLGRTQMMGRCGPRPR